jgi:MoxR-like ATPase
MAVNPEDTAARARETRERLQPLFAQVERVIIGQGAMVERLLVGLLTGGHVLLEGVPGLAKTLAARTLAGGLRLTFRRIQFTPDLLPADVVGTQVYNPRTGEFSIKKGPVFANLVLADEINRAPAKVQSALLEAMQEKQVTIGEVTYPLGEPFVVIATQNPIEQQGTYPLPEAQLDRFMLKLRLEYPSREEELRILQRMAAMEPDLEVEPVLGVEDLLAMRRALDSVYVDERVQRYVVDLVDATRHPGEHGLAELGPLIQYGASPRGTIFLVRAARAEAFLRGREFVTPQDVKAVAHDVLRHRVSVTYEAEAEETTSEEIIRRVLDHLRVP